MKTVLPECEIFHLALTANLSTCGSAEDVTDPLRARVTIRSGGAAIVTPATSTGTAPGCGTPSGAAAPPPHPAGRSSRCRRARA